MPEVSPLVPALAGVPYGIGFVLIFMSLLNYLTDAYEVYAASALAAASCTRSLLGALLPLAAGRMYGTLGIKGAGGLLGGLSVGCLVIPVGFWVWGESLRAGSRFAGEVKARREKEEEDSKRDLGRRRRAEGGDEVDVEKGEEGVQGEGNSGASEGSDGNSRGDRDKSLEAGGDMGIEKQEVEKEAVVASTGFPPDCEY